VEVPSVFELPVTARALARGHDAVVTLGVVIRGGTPHFDYVCQAAALGLTQVAAETGTPVGFGILTCDNEQQAYEEEKLPAAISVGANVTFDGTERRVEAHVIDHPGLDLYGHVVQLDLVRRLHSMRRFACTEDLQATMVTDVEQARAVLRPHPSRPDGNR
jgi:6,7-dimethyl-8-ribityllumazine synthase